MQSLLRKNNDFLGGNQFDGVWPENIVTDYKFISFTLKVSLLHLLECRKISRIVMLSLAFFFPPGQPPAKNSVTNAFKVKDMFMAGAEGPIYL